MTSNNHHDLTTLRTLQDIYRTSECLEIQAREAVGSMNGRYGTYAKCTKQDAMYAMGLAVQEGYLEKSGDGANTRYRYAKQTLRAVK